MAQGTTVINRFGTLVGWNRAKVVFGGRTFEGITEIEYEEIHDGKGAKGAGGYDVGFEEGDINANASISLFQEEVMAIQNSLPPGKKFTDMDFQDIPVVFRLPSGEIYKDVLRNAKWLKNTGVNVKTGDGKIVTKFPLYISHVAPNGVDPT
jgi:hypothetical protein